MESLYLFFHLMSWSELILGSINVTFVFILLKRCFG